MIESTIDDNTILEYKGRYISIKIPYWHFHLIFWSKTNKELWRMFNLGTPHSWEVGWPAFQILTFFHSADFEAEIFPPQNLSKIRLYFMKWKFLSKMLWKFFPYRKNFRPDKKYPQCNSLLHFIIFRPGGDPLKWKWFGY